MTFAEWIHAPWGKSLFCSSSNLTKPGSALLYSLQLFAIVFSVFLCSLRERGSTRTNQIWMAFCLPPPSASESTLEHFPSFVCVPPTFSQHESDFNIQQWFLSAPQPPRTRIPQRGAVNFSNWHPVAFLPPLFFRRSFLNSLFLLPSLILVTSPTPTWMWLHQATAAVKATERGDNSHRHRVWYGVDNFHRFPLSHVSSQGLNNLHV